MSKTQTLKQKSKNPRSKILPFPFLENTVYSLSVSDFEKSWPDTLMACLEVARHHCSFKVNRASKTFEFTLNGNEIELPLVFDRLDPSLLDSVQFLADIEISRLKQEEKINRRRAALEKLDRLDPSLRKDLGL